MPSKPEKFDEQPLTYGVQCRKTGEVFAAFRHAPDRFNVCERMGWNKHDHNKMVDINTHAAEVLRLAGEWAEAEDKWVRMRETKAALLAAVRKMKEVGDATATD